MRAVKIIGWMGVMAMAAAIGNGFLNGNFTEDGGELLRNHGASFHWSTCMWDLSFSRSG